MALSTYDQQFLNEEQKKKIQAFTQAWNQARARGDKAGMEAAHAAAERVRAEADYSGTRDGSGFVELGSRAGSGTSGQEANGQVSVKDGYTPAQLPGYRAGTDQVNRVYDAAQKAREAELRGAFEESDAAIRQEMRSVPGVYQEQKSAAAALSEQSGRNFREYASAVGLASGAGGQAELARANQLQADLNSLGRQEAEAATKLMDSLTQLKVRYRNDLAQAVAQGEFERAEALLAEYRKEEESRVSTAREQADEDYRSYESQVKAQSESYERARRRAETLAEFGDFSGYRALGYTDSEIRAMYDAWRAKNDDLAARMGL